MIRSVRSIRSFVLKPEPQAKLEPQRPSTEKPRQEATQTIMTFEGTEFARNSYLKFVMSTGGLVTMHDTTPSSVRGNYAANNDHISFVFSNCWYNGTVSGNVVYGTARFTSGPNAGTTWQFRLERK